MRRKLSTEKSKLQVERLQVERLQMELWSFELKVFLMPVGFRVNEDVMLDFVLLILHVIPCL